MLMLTRIHAYKLDGNKFQFSYAHGTNFLLVGGHYDKEAESLLHREMAIMNIKTIASVFIPDWTEYYCGDGSQFGRLLEAVKPTHIIIPAWHSEKIFVVRMKSYIERYKTKNMFVDIQNVYNDFQSHDKDIPNRSNNNIVIISKISGITKKAIYAYRFESNGKWTTINLNENNYESFQLKSDVVIFPTFDKSVLQEMDESARKLNANVYVKYLESEKLSLWKQMLKERRLSYNVAKDDVVVSRNDLSVASCYYFKPKNKLITEKREYDIK